MFNNENGSNHLYRHSMSSENMSGGIVSFSNKEEYKKQIEKAQKEAKKEAVQ